MLFKLLSSYILGPQADATSGDPDASASFEELLYLSDAVVSARYTLAADAPQSVSFGGLSNASAVILKSTGKVTVKITSADGTSQAVPVDSYLALLCQSVPVTAIDLVRVPGVSVTVKVFLGQTA